MKKNPRQSYPVGVAQIEMIAVFCPECHEAHYDKSGVDWSVLSFEGKGKIAGTVATCMTCGTKFKMPSIISRLGQ